MTTSSTQWRIFPKKKQDEVGAPPTRNHASATDSCNMVISGRLFEQSSSTVNEVKKTDGEWFLKNYLP